MIPETKQIIVMCIGLVAFCTVIGWAFGGIASGDARLIVLTAFTGFFTLLKGEQ
jgi:hypothetical protein